MTVSEKIVIELTKEQIGFLLNRLPNPHYFGDRTNISHMRQMKVLSEIAYELAMALRNSEPEKEAKK